MFFKICLGVYYEEKFTLFVEAADLIRTLFIETK